MDDGRIKNYTINCRQPRLSIDCIIYAAPTLLTYVLSDWSGANDHERVQRQLSVSSDSKLLDDDIREETKVIMRPKKPPRPKSEVFLNKQDPLARRKRFSAFGVSDAKGCHAIEFHWPHTCQRMNSGSVEIPSD